MSEYKLVYLFQLPASIASHHNLLTAEVVKCVSYKNGSSFTAMLLHVLSPATERCRARKYCFTGVVGMLRFIPRRWLPCCRRRLLPKGRHFLVRRPLELGLGSNIHVVSPPHSKICLKDNCIIMMTYGWQAC